MPPAKSSRSRFFDFLLIFAVVFLLAEVVLPRFFGDGNEEEQPRGIVLTAEDATIRGGLHPVIVVQNGTQTGYSLPSRCPLPPVEVYLVENAGATNESFSPLRLSSGSELALPCEPMATVAAGEEGRFSLGPWKYAFFDEYGTYELRIPGEGSGSGTLTTRIETYEPGAFVKLFRVLITKPFLNFLVFIGDVLPNHSLAWGIIILTILVKLLLFIPTQHALEGQKKMQLLQPKLEAVRKEHGDNPQKLHEETMKLWKEHKVNPFQSCLPILLQFPILIGLFYVIRDDAVLETSRDLIYSFYRDISWTFDTSFLGMDLTQPSLIFPPLLVVLQFIQMKLSFAIADKKKAQQVEKALEEKDNPQGMQQKIMLYFLPLLIGFFALRFPAAVSLYWGVSTVFAIGQQMIVNREHLSVRN